MDVAESEMGERYGALRIVNPRADDAMVKSIRKYGQISPVVCTRIEDSYELIDGFKRLRACRRMKKETVRARILTTTCRVVKAAIIQLNRGRSISAVEEAMVLSSLYREDGLTQVEIAALLGRHKSWVSRRIALIEQLDEEVLAYMRLGLLSVSTGRELARLPRGNQKEAAASLIKHRFSTREAMRLIAYLLVRPGYEHSLILARPWEVMGPREHRPEGLAGRLVLLERVSAAVTKELETTTPQGVSGLLNVCLASAERLVAALKEGRFEPSGV